MPPIRRTLSDFMLNAASISVAFTSAIFAGYMILYGAQEQPASVSGLAQGMIEDPIDRRNAAPRRWAADTGQSDTMTTASIRDPADDKPRKLRPEAPFDGDALTNSYVLRAVFQGTALIEIKNELSAELWPATQGSFVPGAGKVIAIERRNDRWHVVTTERTIAEAAR